MYLVQLLVRDLAGFISGWTYVTTASYVFPNHTTEGVATFYIPDNEPDFPGLEQVGCSILNLRDYSAPCAGVLERAGAVQPEHGAVPPRGEERAVVLVRGPRRLRSLLPQEVAEPMLRDGGFHSGRHNYFFSPTSWLCWLSITVYIHPPYFDTLTERPFYRREV